jgi:HEAT repeat protein
MKSDFIDLISQLDDPQRIAAIKEIDLCAHPELEIYLLDLVEDEQLSQAERLAAIEALIKSSNAELSTHAVTLSSSPQDQIRYFTAMALGNTGVKGFSLLCQLLTDNVNTVRNVAERSLIDQIDQVDAATMERLLQLIEHPTPLIRSPAARLLGLSRSLQAYAPLLKMLTHDKQWLGRLWAAKGLGDLGLMQAVEPLTQAMASDDKNRVRAACAEAIGKLRPTNAAEILRTALNDEDGGVRKIASEQLVALGFEGETEEEDPFTIEQED